jgi:hypothetical protein
LRETVLKKFYCLRVYVLENELIIRKKKRNSFTKKLFYFKNVLIC